MEAIGGKKGFVVIITKGTDIDATAIGQQYPRLFSPILSESD
jgi:hypothetical protein